MKLVSLAALAALAACARPSVSDLLARATWVDLTYDFDSTTIYWPTAKPFRLEVVSAQRTAAGYYYAANNIAAAEHGGTHLDAPVHFAEGKHTTDQIPITQLAGVARSEEHTSELQSRLHLVCRLLLEKKKKKHKTTAANTTKTSRCT